MNQLDAKTIVEYLKSKCHKDQPIDIDVEQNILNSPPNASEPIEKYFSKLQTVQCKLKNSKKPVKDVTMKHIARGQLQKIPHLQQAANNWDDYEDPNGTKTFAQIQKYLSKKI